MQIRNKKIKKGNLNLYLIFPLEEQQEKNEKKMDIPY